MSSLVIGGLAGLIMAAVVAGVLLYLDAGDTSRFDQQAQRLESLAAQSESQTGRLDAAEGAVAELGSQVREVTAAVGQLQASLDDLQSSAEANRDNLDRMAQSIEGWGSAAAMSAEGGEAGEAVAELRDTIATLDQRLDGLERGDNLDQLTASIARMEEEIAALRQQATERGLAAESATALGRAYAALTERVAAGAPFAAELEAVTAELPGAPGLEALRPHAAEGVATLSDLQTRLAALEFEMPRQEPGETAAAEGVWQTMRQRVEGMVKVRRAEEADWPAILRRAGEALRAGDIAAAIAEVEQAGGAPPGDSEAWLADARARRDAQAGLDELSDAVLRHFAGRQ